jgi:hypothetical protein
MRVEGLDNIEWGRHREKKRVDMNSKPQHKSAFKLKLSPTSMTWSPLIISPLQAPRRKGLSEVDMVNLPLNGSKYPPKVLCLLSKWGAIHAL